MNFWEAFIELSPAHTTLCLLTLKRPYTYETLISHSLSWKLRTLFKVVFLLAAIYVCCENKFELEAKAP